MVEGLKITTARKEKNFSQQELASKLHVSQPTVASWEKGTRSLSADQIEQLSLVLNKPVAYFLGETRRTNEIKLDPVKIPICEAEASAGHGCLNDTETVENYLMIDRELVRGELQCNPDHLMIVRVRGDSMTPTIKPGEMVVIDKTTNAFATDGLYVMRIHGDSVVVKRIQTLPGGKINVISDNKAYPSYQVDLSDCDDMAVIGRVMTIIAMEKVGA